MTVLLRRWDEKRERQVIGRMVRREENGVADWMCCGGAVHRLVRGRMSEGNYDLMMNELWLYVSA